MYTCPALTVPSDGIKFGCPENATQYNDTVCQFSCNDGYIGSGSQARRCQHNGTWSGQAFTCQSRYFKPLNKYLNYDVSCSFPKREPFDPKFSVGIKLHGTEIQSKEFSKIWLHLASLLSKETKKARKNLAVKRNYF